MGVIVGTKLSGYSDPSRCTYHRYGLELRMEIGGNGADGYIGGEGSSEDCPER